MHATYLLFLAPCSAAFSPQYHVIHDDFFETVQGDYITKDVTIKWQMLVGFKTNFETEQIGARNVILTTKQGKNSTTTRANKQLCSNNNHHVLTTCVDEKITNTPDFTHKQEDHKSPTVPPSDKVAAPVAV